MKILIVTPFLPYSKVYHGGGKLTYNIIKALSQKHEIHLVSRIEPEQFLYVEELNKFCKEIKLVPSKIPSKPNLIPTLAIILSYFYLEFKANRLIKKDDFDLVQIEYVETGLLINKIRGLPLIIHAHDVITKPAERRYRSSRGIMKRPFYYLKWKFIKSLERYIVKKFDMVFTESRQDKAMLLRLNKRLTIRVTSYPLAHLAPFTSRQKREAGMILFAGAMYRDVNINAVLYFYYQILPHIRGEIPEVKFYIVGHKPAPRIRKIAEIDKQVVVTGFVEKIEPYYLRASVFASPLQTGGGIIVKNVDAMAFGLPVVTTSRGNEGLEAVPDRDVLIGEEPEDFAKKVVALLKNKTLWDTIARNGQRFVNERFNLDLIINRIEQAYKELTG